MSTTSNIELKRVEDKTDRKLIILYEEDLTYDEKEIIHDLSRDICIIDEHKAKRSAIEELLSYSTIILIDLRLFRQYWTDNKQHATQRKDITIVNLRKKEIHINDIEAVKKALGAQFVQKNLQKNKKTMLEFINSCADHIPLEMALTDSKCMYYVKRLLK